jgi:hypothetical protein
MAAQLASETLAISRVLAKINDPVRAEAYAALGIATLCRTGLMHDAVNEFLGMAPSGVSGLLEPSGTHPGGEHHDQSAAPAVGSSATPAPAMEA